MYIDFHTHTAKKSNAIYNVIVGENKIPKSLWFSVGIHPWYIKKDYSKQLEYLEQILAQNHKNLLLIGECGIDKNKASASITTQTIVLEKQIEFSEKYNKPLVLHCVKAYNELIALHQKLHPKQKWIIHGFNKKEQLAQQLIKQGFYLSFGYDTLQRIDYLKRIPLDKLFLETDDNSGKSIEEIYILASQKLNKSKEELARVIKKNLWTVIG